MRINTDRYEGTVAWQDGNALNRAAVRAFKPIPEGMRNTLMPDNDKEFAVHKELSQALGPDIYFAHPYRSWERGLNEHTNGLIKQYLPKKIPFNTLTQKQLNKIVDKINNRPRKVLGCLTPYEVFRHKIRTSKKFGDLGCFFDEAMRPRYESQPLTPGLPLIRLLL
jgi:IS30 family transposase